MVSLISLAIFPLRSQHGTWEDKSQCVTVLPLQDLNALGLSKVFEI